MQYSSLHNLCDICNQKKTPPSFAGYHNQFDLIPETEQDCRCTLYKDPLMNNKNSNSNSLGTAWQGTIKQGKYPFGTEYHKELDPNFCASNNTCRYSNSFRKSLEECEPWCGSDVCKEWGNALEKYNCCKAQGRNDCIKPQNPRYSNCKRMWKTL